MRIKSFDAAFTTTDNDGEFEALVAVFGNIDRGGDQIEPGAFTRTLKEWAASGDPIPVIWSHGWHDPENHIGYVAEAKETAEGLLVRGVLDSDPRSQKVRRLLAGRRIKEFSFGYDLREYAVNKETGVWHLTDVDLWEVGPTLKGMNPDTRLVGAKTLVRGSVDEIVRAAKAGDLEATALLTELRDSLNRVVPPGSPDAPTVTVEEPAEPVNTGPSDSDLAALLDAQLAELDAYTIEPPVEG